MNSTSFKIIGNGGDSVMINGTSVSLEDWEKAVKGEKVILKSSAGKDIVFEGKPKTRKIPNLLFDGELLFGDEIKLFLKKMKKGIKGRKKSKYWSKSAHGTAGDAA